MAEDKDGGLNYLKEAFHWQYNKIALIGAVAFAVVSGSALPLLLGAGLELMYLSTVPANSRFQRLVRSWKFDEEKRQRMKSLSALFYELPPEMQARYGNLDAICRGIRQNYTRLTSTSQMFVDQMESKLEELSQSYIRLLNSAFQHREYADVEAILIRARMKSALENDTVLGEDDLKAAIEDFIPPSYPTEIELQTLYAVLECTSKSLLPDPYRSMDRGELVRRTNGLSALTRG